MKCPAMLTVGPMRYRVIQTDDCFMDNRLGETDHARLTIKVGHGIPHDQQAETLTHELLHAITHLAKFHDPIKSMTNEELVGRLAPLLLQALRANPEMVAFLVSEPS